MTIVYGKLPEFVDRFDFDLPEVMYWLYLPVKMEIGYTDIRLPESLECCRPVIDRALRHASVLYRYAYLSARKGWASPDNPLNRPGWHCDGFGTKDLNFVWWTGPSTRFANQHFDGIVSDHNRSAEQFNEQVKSESIVTYPEKHLYCIDPSVVHATPVIAPPGCMRQYVKVSLSDHQYNLENNSHNYLFDYTWPLHPRELLRNDPHRAQLDYVS
jgi:hypothetical protein